MRTQLVLALAVLCSPAAALASPVSVQVLSAQGQPIAGAVVSITQPGVVASVARKTYVMSQRDIAFDPHVLIVPVGATVAFPNLDKVRHHVYSFSPAKRFELKLFGREESRTITFDKPGAVALGCNIHDTMSGVIFVTATPYAAVTGPDGRAQLNLAQSGAGTLAVWHPSIKGSANTQSQPISVAATGQAATVRLRR